MGASIAPDPPRRIRASTTNRAASAFRVALLVAPPADGDEILRAFVALPLVRQVMDLEADAGAAVLAEPAGAVERHLAPVLPSIAAEVLPVFALPLLPRFPASRPSPRLEHLRERREQRDRDEENDQLRGYVERGRRLREEHHGRVSSQHADFNHSAGWFAPPTRPDQVAGFVNEHQWRQREGLDP